MTGLQKVLIENPNIKEVYFDANGGFVWSVSKLHPVCKSREELLADLPKATAKAEAKEVEVEAPQPDEPKESKPPKANSKK